MKISIIGAPAVWGRYRILHRPRGAGNELVLTGYRHRERLEQYISDLQTAIFGLNTAIRRHAGHIANSGIVIIAAGSADMSAGLPAVYSANVPVIRSVAPLSNGHVRGGHRHGH
jgi:malate/lactate dehydrogenase